MIHVLRKPLSEGTVASNVVKHGTGGLNIDASRIASPGEEITTHTQGRGDDGFAANAVYGDYRGGFNTHQTEGQKLGRWPTNVILQHLDGPGCPVARLDEQSGVLAPQGGQKHKDTKEGSFLETGFGGSPTSTFYGDTGGASRFYKQIGGKENA